MKILVTGGSGFIGSALINSLVNENVKIYCADFHDRKEYRIGYNVFIDPEEVLLKNYDLIYHLGACSNTLEGDVEYIEDINTLYSMRLFNYAVKKQIPFVYASSASVYCAKSPYSQSKKIFDRWIEGRKKYPPFWYGLRFHNVYGPNEYHKGAMSSFVLSAYQQIVDNGFVQLFGHTKFNIRRDFVYVKDVVDILKTIVDVPKHKSGIYDLGTGQSRSFEDLSNILFDKLKVPRDIRYIKMPEHIEKQYQYWTQANSGLTDVLYYTYASLEDGIADYVRYLNKHKFIRGH